MIQIELDEIELKKLYLEEIQKKLEDIEFNSMLMDSKQLCKMLSLSWPTIDKTFMSDPSFPRMRIGKKWVFNRREVQAYIDCWSIRNKKGGASTDTKQTGTEWR
ncbi:DNA-binding protein [Fictibacillus sp. S7]|uniref:DNA-binding protein n=1 Tax=Fictibacillus sp. S7 TaxID=2212476 RepID=UPI001011DD0D|nr:DNA-binding protein [Fictibacillus sp. S7]RXZ00854.1 DNA-binding protein [Fictibacillus sp. S7]